MSKVQSDALLAQIPVTGQYVIVQDTRTVGILMPAVGHEEPLRSSLEASGYAVKAPEELVDLAAECHVEDTRPCDISVVVNFTRDLARDARTEAPELDQLMRTGYRDEAEVRQVLEATRDRLPEQNRAEADEAMGYLWPSKTASAQAG